MGPGTSEPLAEGPGPAQASDYPLTDQVPLELCEDGEHSEHRPAGSRGRVDRLIKYAQAPDRRHRVHQARSPGSFSRAPGGPRWGVQGARYRPRRNLHERVEGGAAFLSTANAM